MHITPYKSKHQIRFVTAAALFDGHDASINIMRRILQSSGAEVIHLGHNQAAEVVVDAAIQEDAQGIAVSSYQGGHMEFFKYMYDLLQKKGAGHIRIYGGGGGVIVPREIKELHAYGIARIFSPEDGRRMGLQGMINLMLEECDWVMNPWGDKNLPGLENGQKAGILAQELKQLNPTDVVKIAQFITFAENDTEETFHRALGLINGEMKTIPVLGITGTGGAGKSSLTDELVRRFLNDFEDKTVAVLSVDPSKRKTGGALLGDRIRMNAIRNPRCYMRSLATRDSKSELSHAIREAIAVTKMAGFDLIIVETSGIGQGDAEIIDIADISVYAMTPEYGAASQLEKIDMIDFADFIALNKFDRRGAEDALRDVRKQYQRSRQLFDKNVEEMPVYGTISSHFNDPGVNQLYLRLIDHLNGKFDLQWQSQITPEMCRRTEKDVIIPPDRTRYLSEIAHTVRNYKKWAQAQAEIASGLYQLYGALVMLGDEPPCRLGSYPKDATSDDPVIQALRDKWQENLDQLDKHCHKLLAGLPEFYQQYQGDEFVYQVRGKEFRVALVTESLSHLKIPKVCLPQYRDWGDVLAWRLLENVPGEFPYTAGVFPLKRTGEDPTRMFAGEGPPERTNKRFHYVSRDYTAKRLSTAFDSVTLYGEDPHERPDIYGKIGEGGVSIATLDDMKKLYAGFDLVSPHNSVSMTINGPAPTILAFFMNTAIDQLCTKWLVDNAKLPADALWLESSINVDTGEPFRVLADAWKYVPDEVYQELKACALQNVRGTVQADILKEDQAQNTCIFSTEFALKAMGDVQQYFIDQKVRNFYSVSISGYHIAEAGANPISQLAFTLANGFTYVEYYLSRGMDIDDFAPNLSYFFSNGLDPEYSVIGRVARRIWATAIKNKYGGNERSQKLKYHIQTSGRSLHAMEIDFNDIRTTLQALIAIYDNCNSLHTNAYDEAITTPTEESVRRALAIQMIINREFGLAKNENPNQGAFIIEELTELVEEAVLSEFERISDRGGVLGAMETQYQRGKIQEESLYYEHLKHSGALPIVGVNMFLNPTADDVEKADSIALARSSQAEKDAQIRNLRAFQERHKQEAPAALRRLQQVALSHGNIFEELMETVKYASLGQITHALYQVGGEYRRNM
ncbi:MAG: methylmalonyl-CoA mutase [Gemmatimonadetes bacterium]|nr:MAG: methylmalonyl-CoA mutase [Gemmatimonadota bacterium]